MTTALVSLLVTLFISFVIYYASQKLITDAAVQRVGYFLAGLIALMGLLNFALVLVGHAPFFIL